MAPIGGGLGATLAAGVITQSGDGSSSRNCHSRQAQQKVAFRHELGGHCAGERAPRMAFAGSTFVFAALRGGSCSSRQLRKTIHAAAAGTIEQSLKVISTGLAVGASTGIAVLVFEKFIQFLEHAREELPFPELAPVIGAVLLIGLYAVAGPGGLKGTDTGSLRAALKPGGKPAPDNWPFRAAGNATAAAISLGFGNSLGPEAPAAAVGVNVAFGLSKLLGIASQDDEPSEPSTNNITDEQRHLISKALEGSKVVATLEEQDLKRLWGSFREIDISAGDVLIRQGALVDDSEPGLFIIQSGTLDVFVASEEALKIAQPDAITGDKVFTYEKSGAVIGELAVLFDAPRAATVVAKTDSVLLSVDRRSFRAAGGRAEGAMKLGNISPASLLASGAAAGVAAGFNAPISGIFFAQEVVKPQGENSLDLTARLLAAALSAAMLKSFGAQDGPALTLSTYSWRGGIQELVLFLFLGVVTGAFSYGTKRLSGASRKAFGLIEEAGFPAMLLPLVGSISTVLISLVCSGRVMFDGFGAFNEVLSDASIPVTDSPWSIASLMMPRNQGTVALTAAALFGLAVLKALATSICQVSGLAGGVFAPALLTGACVGGAVGRIAEYALGDLVSNAATYVLVGSASMLAANCNVPITSVVLAIELSGGRDYGAALPLIACIAMSFFVSTILLPSLIEGLRRDDALKALESSDDLI